MEQQRAVLNTGGLKSGVFSSYPAASPLPRDVTTPRLQGHPKTHPNFDRVSINLTKIKHKAGLERLYSSEDGEGGG